MKERARSFRREMTSAENKMWYFLRNRRFHDYKFVREYVIGSYIVDFTCRQKKIIIESPSQKALREKAFYSQPV